jgi:hypothetical protein
VVDFHALRATYITLLVKGGASVKVAQELARHSDPKLTMNVYTKLGVHDLTGALDALPSLTGDEPTSEAARATGTYDTTPDSARNRLRNGGANRRNSAQRGTMSDDDSSAGGDAQKHLVFKAERDSARRGATPRSETPPAGFEPATVGLEIRCSIP